MFRGGITCENVQIRVGVSNTYHSACLPPPHCTKGEGDCTYLLGPRRDVI